MHVGVQQRTLFSLQTRKVPPLPRSLHSHSLLCILITGVSMFAWRLEIGNTVHVPFDLLAAGASYVSILSGSIVRKSAFAQHTLFLF